MTQALIYTMLHDSGCKAEAEILIDKNSVFIEEDWAAQTTLYGFADGSAILESETEFRLATEAEISAANLQTSKDEP